MPDTIYSNTFEGWSNGQTWTVAGSGGGSGTALSAAGGNGSFDVVNTVPGVAQGTLCLRLTPGTSSTYIRADDPAPSGREGIRRPFLYQGAPTSEIFLGAMRDSADVLMCSFVIATSTGFPRIRNNSTIAQTHTSNPFTAGNIYWFEMFATPGASTTTGTLECVVYATDGVTPLWTASGLTGNQNLGTTNPASRLRFGGMGQSLGWTYDYIDSIRWGHVASGPIGPIANQAPTASCPPYQNLSAPGSTTVTFLAADSDGTIASMAVSRVANKSTVSPSLTNTSSGAGVTSLTTTIASFAKGNLLTLQCLVTDNGGATTTVYHEVRCQTDTDVSIIDVVIDVAGDAGWTTFGSPASEAVGLNDGLSTTGVESPSMTGSPVLHAWRVAPMLPRGALRFLIDGVQQTLSGSHAGTKFRLAVGPTNTSIAEAAASALKDQSTGATSDVSLSSQNLYFDLTSTELAAISDWGDVRMIEIVAS